MRVDGETADGILPSGRQVEIRYGDQRAVVVEVGGTLREYEVAGFPVIDGFAAGEMCTAARGNPLVPWPNRLRDGRYRFGGVVHQTAITETGRRNAIHGLGRWRSWRLVESAPGRVRAELLLHPEPGYPFTLLCTADHELTATGLRVTLAGRNLGSQPLPYAAGHHPFIRAALGGIDTSILHCPARSRLVLDRRRIPTGERRAVAGIYDFRRPRRIGTRRLDVPLTDLEAGPDGRTRVVLSARDRTVTLWMDHAFPYVMLFSGDSLPAEERRRGLAVEPMTAAPNAFGSGDGLVVLEPGASHSATWGICVEPHRGR